MTRCTAPVRGHVSDAGAASCPVHGAQSSGGQVPPLPVVTPVVTSPSVHVVPLPDGGQREEWQVGGRHHRTDGPAWVERNAAGVVVHEEWWVEGRRHRLDGPAVVWRNDAGVVVREEWFVDGRHHRTDGPAYVERNDAGVAVREGWWEEGRYHRTDGPAWVVRNDAGVAVREEWLVEDRQHRTDGPAWVVRNDAGVVVREKWWVKGEPFTPGEVLGAFLAERGVADLSAEALTFLVSTRPYEQWVDITDNEIALARLLHPTTEAG